MKDNAAIVQAAVLQRGGALQYVCEDMKNDPAILLAAFQQMGIKFDGLTAEEMENNESIVHAAVKQDWEAHKCAPKYLQTTETVLEAVKAIVTKDGRSLQYASEEMKNNAEIVQAAVKQDWKAHKYASKEMQKTEAVLAAVQVAVQQDWKALFFCSEEMKNTWRIVKVALQKEGLETGCDPSKTGYAPDVEKKK